MLPWRVDPSLVEWLRSKPDPRMTLEALIRHAMVDGMPSASAHPITDPHVEDLEREPFYDP